MKAIFIVVLLLFCFFSFKSFAQTNETDETSLLIHETDGIGIASTDSSYKINFRFRMQNRFEMESSESDPFQFTRKTF